MDRFTCFERIKKLISYHNLMRLLAFTILIYQIIDLTSDYLTYKTVLKMEYKVSEEKETMGTKALDLNDCLLSYGLSQIVNVFTYPTDCNIGLSTSILDLIFLNDISFLNDFKVIPNLMKSCDHYALIAKLKIPYALKGFKTIQRYDYNDNALNNLNDELYNTNWRSLIGTSHCINEIYDVMFSKFSNIFDKHIHLKSITIREKYYPKHIMKLIHKKRKLTKIYDHKSIKYNILCDLIGDEIEKFNSIKMNKLVSNNDNLGSFYNSIKRINNVQNELNFRSDNKEEITDINEIVSEFSNYFASNYNNQIDSNLNYDDNAANKLSVLKVSMTDLLRAINKFKTNKSEGPTLIPNLVLKKCVNGI